MKASVAAALVINGALLFAHTITAETTVLDTYDSPYNHVIVLQDSNVVSFKRVENGAIVSAIDRANPARQVIIYTGYLFAPALFHPAPERVLNIGLGAGAVNRLFTKLFPDALLVSVEIDPMIFEATVKYTDFVESQNNRVVIQDGRVFLRRDDTQWDWIIIDTFVKRSQLPPRLSSLEFYHLVSDHLSEQGVVVINLISGSRLFDSQVATLQAAFPQVLFFRVSKGGNVIALCVNFGEPSLLAVLEGLDPKALPDTRAYGVDFEEIKASVIPPADPALNQSGEILIEDSAPVEFLDPLKSSSGS